MIDDEQTVLVVKTNKVEEVKSFLEGYGISFTQEKHGDGPIHYSVVNGNIVFEIYPNIRNNGV